MHFRPISRVLALRKVTAGILLLACFSGVSSAEKLTQESLGTSSPSVELIILGIAQDAGYPQIGCYQAHCMPAWNDPSKRRLATSLAIVDRQAQSKYLMEATPDIKQQLFNLHRIASDQHYQLNGIFLTHAHMGHYAGLIHLGREAMGSKNIPIFAMPKMTRFLSTNGPWEQLVKLNNIKLMPLQSNQWQTLSKQLSIKPIQVPHRDEYSETVGYKISGPNKSALFIPDIDKWQKWHLNIAEQIKKVDFALLDATFYANGELPNRDMSEVPHPFVEESMQLLKDLTAKDKAKVIFIHFNHSNPLLIKNSPAQQQVQKNGFKFATEGMILQL